MVVKRLTSHRQAADSLPGIWDYRVRWYDGSLSWEPTHNIPRHYVVAYCQRKSLPLPPDIDRAEIGFIDTDCIWNPPPSERGDREHAHYNRGALARQKGKTECQN
eukprot:IDg22467t1